MNILQSHDYLTISNHDIAEVRKKLSNGQNALFAQRDFVPDEIIADFSAGTISPIPTYLTVQVGFRKHITLQPEFLQYINHSCSPNAFFNTTTMQLVALAVIKNSEELSFFYPSAEWKMKQPFRCYCGSKNCIGDIKGASFLSENIIKQYKFTDYIMRQFARKAAKKVASAL